MDRIDPTPARDHAAPPWDEDALARLDAEVESQPFIIRISAARRLRDRVEQDARAAQEGRISAERVRLSLELVPT